MNLRLFAAIAFLSLVCVGCDSNPLAQKLPGGGAPATTESPRRPRILTESYDDLQVNASELVMRLTEITLAEDSTIATVSITNGRREIININTKKENIILYDDEGNTYRLAIPPDNPLIQIQPGTTLNGKFVFIGRLSPEAAYIRLKTVTYYEDQLYSRTRGITLEIKNVRVPREGQNAPRN
ncbi:hypothetical protein NG796_11390 [Laspinema sp. A4]|uniref:hypothetical protein n=1 Tax=Laspinema sp. D2d TaxID=2953686 RepID=UPI0021BA5C6B|nr:hypothetical protein [Laspinema sp. D2d]MCT7983902.1 hypothetical protein [Laspinema sp. D2d]